MNLQALNEMGFSKVNIEPIISPAAPTLDLIGYSTTDYDYLVEQAQYKIIKLNIVGYDSEGLTKTHLGNATITHFRSEYDMDTDGYTFLSLCDAIGEGFKKVADEICHLETGTVCEEIGLSKAGSLIFINEVYIYTNYRRLGIGSTLMSNISNIVSKLLYCSIDSVVVPLCPSILSVSSCLISDSCCMDHITEWSAFYSKCGYKAFNGSRIYYKQSF